MYPNANRSGPISLPGRLLAVSGGDHAPALGHTEADEFLPLAVEGGDRAAALHGRMARRRSRANGIWEMSDLATDSTVGIDVVSDGPLAPPRKAG